MHQASIVAYSLASKVESGACVKLVAGRETLVMGSSEKEY